MFQPSWWGGGVECCGVLFANDKIAEEEGGGDAGDAAEKAEREAECGTPVEYFMKTVGIKSCAFKRKGDATPDFMH